RGKIGRRIGLLSRAGRSNPEWQTAVRSRAVQERERPDHGRANLYEPEGVGLNFERRDGSERLPPREQAKRVLRRAETLFRSKVWRVFLQYGCVAPLHAWIAWAVALDFATRTRSA